jgi:holo-[acyl-carrier protein] synthase
VILGLGSDIVTITRMEHLLAAYGDRAAQRLLTPAERVIFASFPTHAMKSRASFLAKRFAAKEACVKALGCGFRQGITMQHIGVINNEAGKPSLELSGPALAFLTTHFPHHQGWFLSLSDDYPFAMAVVVLA